MLTMLLVLGVAIGCGMAGAHWPVAAAAAVVLAAWAGTTFPDLDQVLPLGGHRSVLSHSVLPAAIATLRRCWWPVAAGLALGIGLHLSADIFPESMRGFATAKVPGHGALGWQDSYLWFAANAAGALLLGAWLLGQVAGPRTALAVIAVVAFLGIVYLFSIDGGWWALSMFGGTGWLALRRKSRPIGG